MKKNILFCLSVLAAGSLLAADSSPSETVISAAKKLGNSANYAWKAEVVVPDDAQFKPGPTEGKTEKDGFTCYKLSMFDNTIQVVAKGEQRAFTDQEGNWRTVAEMDQDAGPGRFMGMLARNLKTPATEAAEVAGYAKALKRDGELYSGDLSEDGAKALQSFGGRGGNGGPSVTNATGSVKFWVKDGTLSKYELKLKGLMKFGENEFQNDRTTTVEIKDVGTTKVEVPAEAKKKLEPKANTSKS